MAGMNDSSGRAVLITGGATGVGRATALAFAAAGASVMIGDTDDRAEETCRRRGPLLPSRLPKTPSATAKRPASWPAPSH